MKRRLTIVFAALLLLALRTFAQEHPAAVTMPNSEAILAGAKADIDHANNDWVPALRRRNAEAIAAAYTDDGMFIAPDGTVTRGRTAIAAMYAARFPKIKEIHDGGVVQDGAEVVDASTIYEWGHAWLETGQPPVRSGGKYLTVWQRSNDGHWRITHNIAF